MPTILRQDMPSSSWPHPTSYLERDPHSGSPHLVDHRPYYHHTMSAAANTNYALTHPSRGLDYPSTWSAYPEEVIPLPAPPPPPPPPPPQKVWILDCRSCNLFLTNRGMKAVLLLRPSVSLYSTDALPTNCSAYSEAAVQPIPPTSRNALSSRTCECLTQTLCCHGCGNSIGYMIVVPCLRCTQSVGNLQRATNGHRFVFHAAEIVATERRYVVREPGVMASIPPPSSALSAPTFAFSPSAASMASSSPASSERLGSTTSQRMEYSSLSPLAHISNVDRSTMNGMHLYGRPLLDPQRVSPSSTPRPFSTRMSQSSSPALIDDAEYPELDIDTDEEEEVEESDEDRESGYFHATTSTRRELSHNSNPLRSPDTQLSPSAHARRLMLAASSPSAATASARAREILQARTQLDAQRRQLRGAQTQPGHSLLVPPRSPTTPNGSTLTLRLPSHLRTEEKTPLQAGDVVYWNHLIRAGEAPNIRDDPQARRPRRAITFDR